MKRVIKVICQKGRVVATHGRFNRTRVRNPNGIIDRFSRSAGLTIVTDRRTDRHATRSVTIGRIYLPRNIEIDVKTKTD